MDGQSVGLAGGRSFSIPGRLSGLAWRPTLFVAALAVGLIGRALGGWTSPFWFDETFSGVIATQQDFGSLLRWCLSELTGPGYYMPLWAWEKLAGSSNAALRAPSVVLSLGAVLLVYFRGSADRDLRVLWATFAILWLPGLSIASEARPYALLFCCGCVQAIAFVRLIRRPTIGVAFCWTSVSALMCVTNSYAVVIAGVQGLAYLAIHRKAAVATWPALMPLVPMAGWMAVHLPYVLGYATSHAVWYATLPLHDLINLPLFMFGAGLHGAIILAAVAVAQIRLTSRWRPSMPSIRRWSPEAVMALTGVLSFAIIFGLAFVRPGFAARYATSTMPGVLFALAWWGARSLRRDAKPVAIVVAMMFMMALGGIKFAIDQPDGDTRHVFNLEQPSQWLMQRAPERLIFYWDSPTGDYSAAGNLAEVGGFFFRRAGHPIAVDIPRGTAGSNANPLILKMADRHLDTAILWVVTDKRDPYRYPQLDRIDKAWECRDFGGALVVLKACRRR